MPTEDSSPNGPSRGAPANDEVDRGVPATGLRLVSVAAAALIAVPLIVFLALVLLVLPGPWWLAVLLGPALAAGAVWLRLRHADRLVLDRLRPTVSGTPGAERLENLVQGLSLAAGVEYPEVVLVDDSAGNAMAICRSGRTSVVATTGLVDALEVVELEGVVAELLVRLSNGDAESATVGAALVGFPMLEGPLSGLLHPIAGAGFGRLFPSDRDLSADRDAVALTRYPPGLLAALRVLGGKELAPKASSAGLDHMWLVDPRPMSSTAAAPDPSRSDLDLRIDILAEF